MLNGVPHSKFFQTLPRSNVLGTTTTRLIDHPRAMPKAVQRHQAICWWLVLEQVPDGVVDLFNGFLVFCMVNLEVTLWLRSSGSYSFVLHILRTEGNVL